MAIYQDTYYAQVFVFTDLNGVAIDITGWTFSAELRVNVSDADPPLITLTTANGGFTVTDGPNGKLQIALTKAQTSLLPTGAVHTDFMRTDPVNNPVRYFGVTFKVKQPVTRL